MPIHRFEIGSAVSFATEWSPQAEVCRYIIEAQMPPLGALPQYRIKGDTESFRRVVVEHRLVPFSLTPNTVSVGGIAVERAYRPHPGEEN